MAEDIEARGGGAAGVRGFDADKLAARIGVVRVRAVEGNRAASGPAAGGERLTNRWWPGIAPPGGHDARGDGCQDGEGDRLAQAGLVEGLAPAMLPTLAAAGH